MLVIIVAPAMPRWQETLPVGVQGAAHEEAEAGGGTGTSGNGAGGELFEDRCSACHTIGSGPLVGPDLQSAAGRPESDLKGLIRKMEEFVGPLTDAEVQTLADFLKSQTPQAQPAHGNAPLEEQASPAPIEPGSESNGRELFFGMKPLANQGIACMSCHEIAGEGGTLAVDLSAVSSRIGNAGLIAGIQRSGFPVMNAVYRNHPITDAEARDIAAFLTSLAQTEALENERSIPAVFLVSLGLAGLFMALLGVPYRKRNQGVRRRLVEAHSKRGTA